jgi:predicted porin
MKRFLQIRVALGATLCLLSYSASSQELRGAIAAQIDLSPRVSSEIELQARRISLPQTCFNRNVEVKLDYSLFKPLTLSGSYSFSYLSEQPEQLGESDDENSDKHKISADVEFKPERFDNDLRLSNRFRYQYTTIDNSKTREYLRNKLTLDYKISKKMNPYIAIEPYYNLNSSDIHLVRLYLGNEFSFKKSKLELYYIAEKREKNDQIDLQYIVGVVYKFHLVRFEQN